MHVRALPILSAFALERLDERQRSLTSPGVVDQLCELEAVDHAS
jgi:hypothetical protein